MSKFAKIILENNENLLIKKLIRLFKANIKQRGSKRFSFVLTGGKSPVNLYKNLSKDKKFKYPASFLRRKNNFLFHCN